MPASVAFTDNANGTVTATISGGGAADSNAVYTTNFDGADFSTWTLRATIVGNTTGSFTLDAGVYWGYSITGSVVSTLRHFAATSGDQAIHYTCLVAAQSKIQSLALSGISNANVVIRKLNSDHGLTLPGIVLSPLGAEQQGLRLGTNIQDDVTYPIVLSILEAENRDMSSTNLNTRLLWRERINQAFRSQRLSTATTVYIVDVQPGPIVSPSDLWKNIYHSGLILRCTSREGRGV